MTVTVICKHVENEMNEEPCGHTTGCADVSNKLSAMTGQAASPLTLAMITAVG